MTRIGCLLPGLLHRQFCPLMNRENNQVPWIGAGVIAMITCVGFVVMKRGDVPTEPVLDSHVTRSTKAEGTALRPIPDRAPMDERLVALGDRLFHEAGFSGDGSVSCSTCHDLTSGGDDGLDLSVGVGGATGLRNSPTVLNCTFNFVQFWDGRAVTLEEQVDGPLLSEVEMGTTWERVLDFLKDEPSYASEFRELFDDGITAQNFRVALATFERSLITPDSRFDRYLEGDAEAITELEKQGYHLFLEVGCATCHQGVNVGGNLYQRLGTGTVGRIGLSDQGRYSVTNRESDREKFKVPGLRNVARTAPYFHDGSVAELDEAVRQMAHLQLGISLPPQDVEAIVAFLHSLDASHR